jgi:hypothetical protein
MKTLVFFSLVLFSYPVLPQQILWDKTLGGKDFDSPRAMCSDDSANVYLGITGQPDTVSGPGAWIIKADKQGRLLWKRNLGQHSGIHQLKHKDGILHTFGSCYDTLAKKSFLCLVGIDPGGNSIARINLSIPVRSTGNFATLPGGQWWITYLRPADAYYACNDSLFLAKLDQSGNVLMEKFISVGPGTHYMEGTKDGGVVLTARNCRDSSLFVTKLDTDGNTQWIKKWLNTFSYKNANWLNTIYQTADGGYLCAGTSYARPSENIASKGYTDCWLFKLSPGGDMIWQRTYGGSDFDHVAYLAEEKNGNIIVGARSLSRDGDVSLPMKNTSIWLLKLGNSGSLLWEMSYGSENHSYIYGMCLPEDNRIAFLSQVSERSGYVREHFGGFDAWVAMIRNEEQSNVLETKGSEYALHKLGGQEYILRFRDRSKRAAEVYDIRGKLLMRQESAEDMLPLSFAGFATGLYIACIRDNGSFFSLKLTVTR